MLKAGLLQTVDDAIRNIALGDAVQGDGHAFPCQPDGLTIDDNTLPIDQFSHTLDGPLGSRHRAKKLARVAVP